jgi:hypothetical protein
MISNKRRVIVQLVIESNIEYSQITSTALEKHIKEKYKCSQYLARLCVQDLNLKKNEV